MEKNVYLASKPRYEILDGLRGLAAVFVLVYHLCETHFGLGAAHPLNHGYLAVDFFFALSGFVIGYAYDDRWDRMTTWAFFKRRLIRLHPMVICGSVIGALLLYFQQCDAFPGIAQSPWWLVVLAMLWSFTMIPVPKGLEVRGWGETNPLNGPTWSLQWEYLANILYALVIRRLSTRLLACCVCVFAVFTVMHISRYQGGAQYLREYKKPAEGSAGFFFVERRERYHSQKEMSLIYLLFNELSTNHFAFPIKTVQIVRGNTLVIHPSM